MSGFREYGGGAGGAKRACYICGGEGSIFSMFRDNAGNWTCGTCRRNIAGDPVTVALLNAIPTLTNEEMREHNVQAFVNGEDA